jgi:outer membrane murein-binding lipoprotein Lpp
MDCYRRLGNDPIAETLADEVIEAGTDFDGTERSPMRIAEARITLGVVAARQGELEHAVQLGERALAGERKSVPSLVMVSRDLGHADATQLSAIRSELAELRRLIVSGDGASTRAQIDQLHAMVQNLQTAGLRMKNAMDHMHAAQEAQARATEHMMAAAQEQGEALAAFMLPSYPPDAVP